jgi:hypothetical protein
MAKKKEWQEGEMIGYWVTNFGEGHRKKSLLSIPNGFYSHYSKLGYYYGSIGRCCHYQFDYDIYNLRFHSIAKLYICQSLFSWDKNTIHKLVTQYQMFDIRKKDRELYGI